MTAVHRFSRDLKRAGNQTRKIDRVFSQYRIPNSNNFRKISVIYAVRSEHVNVFLRSALSRFLFLNICLLIFLVASCTSSSDEVLQGFTNQISSGKRNDNKEKQSCLLTNLVTFSASTTRGR